MLRIQCEGHSDQARRRLQRASECARPFPITNRSLSLLVSIHRQELRTPSKTTLSASLAHKASHSVSMALGELQSQMPMLKLEVLNVVAARVFKGCTQAMLVVCRYSMCLYLGKHLSLFLSHLAGALARIKIRGREASSAASP